MRGGATILSCFVRPAGESFQDCAFRVIPALFAALLSTRGDILIAGHAGVNRILICQAMGKSMDTVRKEWRLISVYMLGEMIEVNSSR
jgi:probable phosphoglycerate mutase